MKKFLNYLMYASLLLVALNFTSCQEEFEELPTGNEQETFMAASTTAELISQTVSNDGSFDNIVDGSSCFDIRFPYTVAVNGLEITINAIEDLHLIEEIFDALDDDEDLLEILFPITITLADFSEVVINGPEDLRAIAEECTEGGDDDDIECIDFVYPVTLFTFDLNNQQTGSVTVNSDRELRRFFAGLDDADIVSIDFPVTLELFDGTEIVVDSNAELADAIERAKGVCDEDDDDDFNDDDFTKERLDSLLVECPWLVREVKRDNQDQTDQFFEYVMNFKEDGEVVVRDREGNNLIGSWMTRVTDNGALLKLEFDVLVDFSLEWIVYDIGDGRIKLFAGEGNRIILRQFCDMDEDETDDNPDTLREILKECSWIIKRVKNDGEAIRRLIGYEFNFGPEGVVTLSNEEMTSEGSWVITTNNEGVLVLSITFGSEPGVNFEWPLRDLDDTRLKFEVEGFELVLLRECDDSNADGDVPEIRNFLMGGDWIVALYEDNGVNETSNYEGFSLSFDPENTLTVSEGTDAFLTGLWRVLRAGDQGLKLFLNLSEDQLFEEFTEAWYIEEVTNNRIELVYENEDNSFARLVLER